MRRWRSAVVTWGQARATVTRERIGKDALHEGIPWGWESFADYLDADVHDLRAGIDVRGKAVFIYSIPTPSALNHSAKTNGAMLLGHAHGEPAILAREAPRCVRSRAAALFPPAS